MAPKNPGSAAKRAQASKGNAARSRTPPKPKLKQRSEKSKAAARRRKPNDAAPIIGSTLPPSMARPWRVLPERLADWSASDLKPVLRDLILAEAYRAGCDSTRVIINSDDQAADGGADAWTPKPTRPSRWLGDRDTCWQFKAGTAGQPAKLRAEVTKLVPSETVRSGGRFIVVASGATDGVTGRRKRVAALAAAAKKARLPTAGIDAFTSETLAEWLDEHPGLAAALNGLPAGCCSMEFWERHPHHRIQWHPAASASGVIATLQGNLDPTGPILSPHAHIVGAPGVGKTRLVLELCRGAAWRRDVLYIEDGQRVDVYTLLLRLLEHPSATAVVVVDEAVQRDIRLWNGLVARAPERLRLLTIGHESAPTGLQIIEHRVDPLSAAETATLVGSWHAAMPAEHREFVAWFSAGYVRLAKVSADELDRNRALDVHGLLQNPGVRQILDSLLGNAQRRPSLYVLAALESVGWEGEQSVEGRTIAEHLGLDWNRVREDIEQLHREHGIAPRAGNLRYVSPRPLAALVATEAWQTHADLMRTLFDRLPTPGAKLAYEERLRSIATAPQVRAFASTELGRFVDLARFGDEADVRRWAALGHAHPEIACRLACRALGGSTIEERRSVDPRARRQLVWALVRFAWRRDCFRDAALALAHLAVAENETYANNATAEFVGKFQVALGGTEAPYAERFGLLDELVGTAAPEYRVLVVQALGKSVGTGGEMRIGGADESAVPAQPEWRPRTMAEYADIVFGALDRLMRIADSDPDERVERALVAVCGANSMQLRHEPVRASMAELVRRVASRSSRVREDLWRDVHALIASEEKYWKQLGPDDLVWLRLLLAQLEDSTLEGRLHRAVTGAAWDAGPEEHTSLAAELIATPTEWPACWTWLTSGSTPGSWAFGQALARADSDGLFLAAVERLELGPDVRALAAYVNERSAQQSAEWADDWLDRFATLHADRPVLAAELTWRCTATERGARRFMSLAHSMALPPDVSERLSYGGWAESMPHDVLVELIEELIRHPGHRGAAVVLIESRVEKDASFLDSVEPIALQLVCDADVIRESPNHGYYWQKLARLLIPEHARAIARGILAAHDTRSRPARWFLEHSPYAAQTLSACVEADPSAVWDELSPYFADRKLAQLYAIGFPEMLDRMPRREVLEWIAVDPENRGPLVAQMTAKDLDEQSLFCALLERFGNVEEVGAALRRHLYSGEWSGPISVHYEKLASEVRPLTDRSEQPRVARWARGMVRSLEQSVENERQREAEEDVRDR